MYTYNESVVTQRAIQLSKLFSLHSTRETPDNLGRKGRLAPRHVEFINRLWETAESHYPGMCDIQYDLTPKTRTITNSYGITGHREFTVFDKFAIERIYVVIRFPEFVITNTSGHSLTIQNLFVRIPMVVPSNGSRAGHISMEGGMQGMRTTVDLVQYATGYAHSHLHSQGYTNDNIHFSAFCLGESDVNSTCTLIGYSSTAEFDWDLFNLLLLNIDPYVKWESEEGGPYIRMKNVTLKNLDYTKIIGLHHCKSIYQWLEDKLAREDIYLDLDWKFYNGKYSIVDNDKLSLGVANLLLANGVSNSDYFVMKAENGEYYTQGCIAPSSGSFKSWIPFRNRRFKFEVTDNVQTAISNEKYLNPKLKEYVKSRLEYKANFTQIRSDRVSKLSTSTHS